jgi:hypothetical protein
MADKDAAQLNVILHVRRGTPLPGAFLTDEACWIVQALKKGM